MLFRFITEDDDISGASEFTAFSLFILKDTFIAIISHGYSIKNNNFNAEIDDISKFKPSSSLFVRGVRAKNLRSRLCTCGCSIRARLASAALTSTACSTLGSTA